MVDGQNGALLDLIYDAAVDTDLWSSVMASLSLLVDGHSSWMSRLDLATGEGSGVVVGIAPEMQDLYFEHFAAIDPLSNVKDDLGRELPGVITDEYRLPEAALMRTEFYNDFLRPLDTHSVLMLRLGSAGTQSWSINLNRSRSVGKFNRDEVARFTGLHGHLSRAFRLSLRTAKLKTGGSDAAEILYRSGPATFIIDETRRITFANSLAEGLSRQNAIFAREGRLAARDHTLERQLHDALGAALAADARDRRGHIIRLGEDPGSDPIVISIVPLSAQASSVFNPGRSAVVSMVALRQPAALPSLERLRAVFQLTPTQARLTQALCEGHSLRATADALDISLNTARVHLANTLQRTGARRQAELIQLVMQLAKAY